MLTSNVLQHPLPCVRLITPPRGKEEGKQTDKESKPCEELEGKSFPEVTTVIHTYIIYIYNYIYICIYENTCGGNFHWEPQPTNSKVPQLIRVDVVGINVMGFLLFSFSTRLF